MYRCLMPCILLGLVTSALAQTPEPILSLEVRLIAPDTVRPETPFIVRVDLPAEVKDNYRWAVNPSPPVPPVEMESRDGKPLLFIQEITQDTEIIVTGQIPAEGLDPIGWDSVIVRLRGPPEPPGPQPPIPPPPPGPPDPTPPGPTPPDLPEGLAREIYDAAMTVQSPARAQEAQALAGIFTSVASQAAGLNWSPQDMVDRTKQQIEAKLGASYPLWKPVRDQLLVSLDALNLDAEDRNAHIAAWNTIAAALREVR